MKIGLIGIIPSDDYKYNFRDSMRRLGELGYDGIENSEAFLGADTDEKLKIAAEYGIRLITNNCSLQKPLEDAPRAAAEAVKLGVTQSTIWWNGCENRESMLRLAEECNKAGKIFADEGIKLCYHNHGREFYNIFDNQRAFDILAENTDPRYLFFRLDIGWTALGGADPAEVIYRYKGRIGAVHIKDFVSTAPEARVNPEFTAVGTGAVDFIPPLKAAFETGVEWAVVEQDKLRWLSPWESVTAGRYYLKEIGY